MTSDIFRDRSQDEPPRIPPAEALDAHRSGAAAFLDVRDAHELAATGTVPGALHIPAARVVEGADPPLDPAAPLIVFCAAGVRAAAAGRALLARGYKDVRNMGGFRDWVAAGGAVG